MPFDVNDLREQWAYLPLEARQAIVTLLVLCLNWMAKKTSSLAVNRLCPGVYSVIKSTITYPSRCFATPPPCPLTQTLLDGLALRDATIAQMPSRSPNNEEGPAGKVLLLDTFVVQFGEADNLWRDAVYIDDQNVLPRLSPKHQVLVMERATYRHDTIKEKADQIAMESLISKAKGSEMGVSPLSRVNVDLATMMKSAGMGG